MPCCLITNHTCIHSIQQIAALLKTVGAQLLTLVRLVKPPYVRGQLDVLLDIFIRPYRTCHCLLRSRFTGLGRIAQCPFAG
jgi:hypothetical protein